MAKAVLNQNELYVQTAMLEEKYDVAQDLLLKAGNRIRPVYRSIFAASLAFAEGNRERAWEAVAEGLLLDGHNYELYVLLGEYYASLNLQQAYLCYENALFYCDVPGDRAQIVSMMEQLSEQGIQVPKAAIVILSYNLLDMTRDCIDSIRKTTPVSAREMIVIDNASVDGSAAWLKQQRDIKVLCNIENKGFPVGCNQGIGLAEKDSDIFLLNNDTVMTDNALFWLRMGLYENDEVGSTGSVSNYVSNFQAVIENGKSRAEYIEFAKRVNIPVRKPYLNKVHLVGFALLLKRSVLDRAGLLDERFSPGNWEDNDICLRINLAGYRNVLCKNSFIIHWGSQSFGRESQSFGNILEINQNKFFEKWSVIHLEESDYLNIRVDLVDMIEKECDISDSAIMVVGTGCGGLLSCLQDKFPNAQVYGMESHMYMAQVAGRISDTIYTDLDAWKGDELAETFDVIVINDALEDARYSGNVLKELVKMLKPDGKLVFSFVNSQHYTKIGEIETKKNLFSQKQAIEMLADAKLTENTWRYTFVVEETDEAEKRIQQLQDQYPEINRDAFLAYQWINVVERQRRDIQFHNKMVVCIPTCGHPEVVEDVLAHCAELYHRYGLDVYYYDSSRDDTTKRVIERYQRQGYDNLHYIPMDPDMPVYIKFGHIFMQYQLQKKYDYLWYLRERCWCEEKTLKLIYKSLTGQRDLVFMDVGHPNSNQELTICKDVNEFYHRCGDYATSMDVTIYNMNTILKAFDMEEFDRRHGNYIEGFLQYLIIFERLAQIDTPDICLLAGKNVTIYHSQKGHSAWGDQRIEIWGKMWIEANETLPDCYTNKDEIIKRASSLPWILGDINVLLKLHERGILTLEYFEEIKEWWHRISDIPLDTLRQISCGNYKGF